MTDATEHMCVHNSINFSGMMGEEKGDQQTKYLGGEKGMGKRRKVRIIGSLQPKKELSRCF